MFIKTVEQQREAFFEDQPCELLTYHAPRPVMVEYHHDKPVFLQNRLYGRILYGASDYYCSNCHDSVHAWLYWLLGERRKPPYMGRAAMASAQKTFEWFCSERVRLTRI
jgi:hypothetical protein